MPLSRRKLVFTGAFGLGGAVIPFWPLWATSPHVTNLNRDVTHADLADALRDAQPADTLLIEGRHTGNFTLNKPLTLRGADSATIDAGGSGTALVIAAADVNIERLTLTGSGRSKSYTTIWGDAGLRVEGNRAQLRGLNVTGNEWGVLFLGGADSSLTGSEIEDNGSDGIKVMGGRGHIVSHNQVNRNGVGIAVEPRFGDATEDIVAGPGDKEAMQRRFEMRQAAEGAEDITVEANQVRGNGDLGIHADYLTKRLSLVENQVHLTGREREPDRAALQWEIDRSRLFYAGDGLEELIGDGAGSGIILSCLTEDGRVIGNHSHDNLGDGMRVNLTTRTLVEGNRLERNRLGLWIQWADDNTIRANRIADNVEFGLLVDAWRMAFGMAPPGSKGNLMVLNSMVGNRVNAHDTSDWVPSVEEMEALIEAGPIRHEQLEKLQKDPEYRRSLAQSNLKSHRPGTNRWDDGTLGNHYDDFDDVAEGFRDDNRDGVSEVAHPIPGGGHVDQFPLSAVRVAGD